ncbi:MAG TPA: F0F1 ATP synthase subunit A [Kofleriaceae bacterium]|nr:F0F1 ATP synthase subunit A [Kofleriaceae bacterium]
MGEHVTWFDYLRQFSWWRDIHHQLAHYLGRGEGSAVPWQGLIFGPTHFSLGHVWVALLVMLLVFWGSARFFGAVRRGGEAAIVPPANLGFRNIFEMFTDATYSTMVSVMGDKLTRKFLPLIGSLALFIFFSNLLGLIPGLAPATNTLKTNLALALLVFFATHYYGIKEHGFGYIKQFLGPIPLLAPLMFVIEVIGHLARPVSLSLRLMGNMAADHKVVFVFFVLIPWLVPIPFLLLGILVVIIQTLVFCLLAMVYISMALSHDH